MIRDQMTIGGTALPWADRALFAELMLSWDMRSYHLAAGATGPVIFDRGVPDGAGYLRLCGLAVPGHIRTAIDRFRYNTTVFIAPPWPEIFTQDTERRQDFAEAERTCAAVAATYREAGYQLSELPRAPVAERVRFVTDRLG